MKNRPKARKQAKTNSDTARRLPKGGPASASFARQHGTVEAFIGLLAGKTDRVATTEEMNEASACGWAGGLARPARKAPRIKI